MISGITETSAPKMMRLQRDVLPALFAEAKVLFMVRMAEHFADRVKTQGQNNNERMAAAWRLAFGREPTSAELTPLVEYADRQGLANACRLIFNLNEFVFID